MSAKSKKGIMKKIIIVCIATFMLSCSKDSPSDIEPDFIEIFVSKAPLSGANLKYTEVKHNGSKILFFPEDYFVNAGDFLLIYFDKGSTKIKKDNKHIFSAQVRSTISTTSGT